MFPRLPYGAVAVVTPVGGLRREFGAAGHHPARRMPGHIRPRERQSGAHTVPGYQRYALDQPGRVNGVRHHPGRHVLRPGQGAIRCPMTSPTRSALAMAVSAGFTAPMLGKKLVSTTYRLSSSWALQFTSSTEAAGSVPNRQVPAWCAQPAIGMLMSM